MPLVRINEFQLEQIRNYRPVVITQNMIVKEEMIVKPKDPEPEPEPPKIRIRIEAVISTAGNDEQYTGHHLGLLTIGRPFKKMVVTFEDEVTEKELKRIRVLADFPSETARKLRFGVEAIQIHSFRIALLSAVSGGWTFQEDSL